METPSIIATTLERKLSLEGSEILAGAELKKQKIEAPEPEDLAVPPSPTAAAPSTGWTWTNPFAFLYSATPAPVTEEEQRRTALQVQERQALEAAIARAQGDEKNDFDFVPVDAPKPEQELKTQQDAIRALEEQQLRQEQDLKAQQEATKMLEEEQLRQEQELKAQQEAIRALQDQQLQQEAEALEEERLQLEQGQEQELKTQQEATTTTPSSIWNLYGLLGSSSPASSTQTEPDPTEIVPNDPANAPTPNISAEEVAYVFRPSAAPIDPHPGAALAMQTGAEEARAVQDATERSTRAAMPLATPQPEQTDTQTGETKEENEEAVFDAAAEELLETKLSEEAIHTEERIRMEAEALEAARIRMEEEQARQDVLRAAAAEEQARIRREEQAQIEREARARQNGLLLQQQQQQMLLQRQLEQQRLVQERQREAQAAAERREAKARAAFAKSCSTGAPTLAEHYARLIKVRDLIG